MEQFLEKNKYLIFTILIRLYLIHILKDENMYLITLYDLNNHFFQLILGLTITLMDILYLLSSYLYIYNIKDQIIIRLSKKEYNRYCIKKIIKSCIILCLMQVFIHYLFFSQVSYHVFMYSIILLITNIIIFIFDHEQIHSKLIIISLIINSLLKLL